LTYVDVYLLQRVAYSNETSTVRMPAGARVDSAFTWATPPEWPILAADHALVNV